MCGIIGSVNVVWNEDPLNSLLHRGPDSKGYYSHDEVYLGHTRLSIQDLSEAGNQPMISNDGRFILIFNGEFIITGKLENCFFPKGIHLYLAQIQKP